MFFAFSDTRTQAARRWVTAVNNWGRLGRWSFRVCRDPHLLPGLFAGGGTN